jgi:adenine-specific DNA methylase
MNSDRRLIEAAFPLKQASLDSVHEKNVRHGHISTLHIWPARRPLAACRAALIATLLPDPGTPEARKRLVERIGGTIVKRIERKKIGGKTVEIEREETLGGVLHWGRESNPDMDWFRDQIRKAYGGRAPKVLDPFAGGGAIPLEAMRLGCDVTAIDINPVAWFILKCTLEYPQRFAGEKRPLPDFVLKDREFMEAFFKAQGLKGVALRTQLERLGFETSKEMALPGFEAGDPLLDADLAWHVRAWGRWVLQQARRDLAKYYPTYADFEPLAPGRPFDKREMRLVPLKEDGTADVDALNAEFSPEHLADKKNARWVAKQTVAYLWARTVTCKNCRATIPMLKTLWLCRRDNKRLLLALTRNGDSGHLGFAVEHARPSAGRPAERREHDRRLGLGTMTRSGARCPACGAIATQEDIRAAATRQALQSIPMIAVVDGPRGKEYRPLTVAELIASEVDEHTLASNYRSIPGGLPTEPVPRGASRKAGGSAFTVWLYGLTTWRHLFTNRQLVAYSSFLPHTAAVASTFPLRQDGLWAQAVLGYLACVFDKMLDYGNQCTSWYTQNEQITHLFSRFALPFKWDFAESCPMGGASGSWQSMLESVAKSIDVALSVSHSRPVDVRCESAIAARTGLFDVIVTDPPYYDAIPYSDVMDFVYVWLRRMVSGVIDDPSGAMRLALAPKWDHETADGELVDDPARHGNDASASKAAYEEGMYRAFTACARALTDKGALVIVFAHKQPDAWETLVSGVLRAGFVVDASWPIQTEMANRTRAISSAALSSSVWLVCKKRPDSTRPGWDTEVLDEMRANIYTQLREFWDAGIRGPDFVWAATGPALEAYSKHPVVKKANGPGTLTVSEFLRAVRRIVVDFVVGRVLTKGDDGEAVSGLDDVTTYYLLHRNDFRLNDAPAGACILYAVSCGLSDHALADRWDILARVGGQQSAGDEEDESPEDADVEEDAGPGTGSRLKLRPWHQRKRLSMGYDVDGRPAPLIDQVHRLMHFWSAGDQVKVDDYIEERNLRKHAVFHQVLQALIELAPQGSEERSRLESLSNHVAGRGVVPQAPLPLPAEEA